MIFPYDLINKPGTQEDPYLCFVLMPFADQYIEIYRQVIKPVVEGVGLKCIRADDIYSANPIMQDIIDSILKANLIIADLTSKNPNVFYELGIAHAKKQNVILITQNIDDVPFDLKSMRTIVYKQTIAGAEELKLGLRRTIEYFVQEKHVPVREVDELQPITREFINKITLKSSNVVGNYGDTSRVKRARDELVPKLLSHMFATLASKYELDEVELDEADKRLTFPDGYYVLSVGDVESYEDSGDEKMECDIEAVLTISATEAKLAELIEAHGEPFSGTRVHYRAPFDIKNLFKQAKEHGVKVDRLLPNQIDFDINAGTMKILNENDVGILGVFVSDSRVIGRPMKLNKHFVARVVNGELPKEKIHEELKIQWGRQY